MMRWIMLGAGLDPQNEKIGLFSYSFYSVPTRFGNRAIIICEIFLYLPVFSGFQTFVEWYSGFPDNVVHNLIGELINHSYAINFLGFWSVVCGWSLIIIFVFVLIVNPAS